MRKHEKWPVAKLIVDPNNRKSGQTEAELRALGENMKEYGQFTEPWIRPSGKVIHGNRKVLAARLVGITHLDCVETDEDLSETEIRLLNASENLLHVGLSPAEKWEACEALLKLNPTWTQKDLAAHLKLDPSTITRIMAPAKCIPAWQDAFKAGAVGVKDCYAAAKVDPQEQHELLAKKFSGASSNELEQHRRKRNGKRSAAGAKLSEAKCDLPDGACVIIRAKTLTVPIIADLLAEAHKRAKDGKQYEVQTWVGMQRDKAKSA